MSMFRGLLILVLGIFFINVTKKGQNTFKKIPIFGEPIDKLFEKKREYMIVYSLAFSQLIL